MKNRKVPEDNDQLNAVIEEVDICCCERWVMQGKEHRYFVGIVGSDVITVLYLYYVYVQYIFYGHR